MPTTALEAVGISDAGTVRQFNEDRVVVDAALGLLLLADGMGGHRAGDVAAHMGIDIVHRALRGRSVQASGTPAPLLVAVNASINQANQEIHQAARAPGVREGMGTTLAVVAFDGASAVVGHVGDSRVYRLRDDELALLTRDDSLVREAVEQGLISAADAADSHNRSLVTQALGIAPGVDAHVHAVDVREGDVYLLCTDGLSDLVAHDDLELIVNTLKINLPLAARTLVDTAKDNGGYDNVSVILARVLSPSAHGGAGWLARAFARIFGRR